MDLSRLNSIGSVAPHKPTTFSVQRLLPLYRFNNRLWSASLKKNRSINVCCHGSGSARSSNGFPPVLIERSAGEINNGDPMGLAPNGKTQKDMEMMEAMPYKGVHGSDTVVDSDEGIGILRFLKGKRFLVTGGTGFLAKVLMEKILRTAPDVERIYVLIKAEDKESAMERLKCEIVNSDLCGCLQEIHGRNYQAFMLGKLVPVVGNVTEANIGIEAELADRISEEVDVIVNSAANTTFDERYDIALDINTIGPSRLLSFAKTFKNLKLFLQISTAYVNGQRQGRILEKPFHIGDSIAREAVTSEFSANSAQVLDIEAEIQLAFDCRKTTSADASMNQKMKFMGLQRAKMHGWQDTYVFTKAMGEMAINNMRGDLPVVMIRPSVIESTFKEPFPGWMEGNRMMDPIVMYYGKGQLTGFPADPNGVLDVVPADMVVNATLAAMAKHGSTRKPGMHIYHVASSLTNPLVFEDLARLLYEHFIANPYVDSKGRPILVPRMKLFSDTTEFYSHLWSDVVQKSGRAAAAAASHEKLSQRLKSICMKSVEQTKYLANIYEPYTFYGGRFDNTNTQRLREEMSKEERRSFGFEVESIDWKDYICNVHIPGLRRYVMKGRGMCANPQLVGTV